MAIYHLSVKTFKRSSGQSATAAAAYRSGSLVRDERTGEIHDYRRKEGVESSEIIAPACAPGWATDREQLWNKAELSEKRKNAVVAREFEVALPAELTKEQRRELAVKFAQELVKRHGFAADICIHKPSREGDQRNHHAHILVTTRRIGPEGFTEKTRELDEKINRGPREFEHWRERFARLTNEALEKHQRQERVDHRTLLAQGINRAPQQHLGPKATAIERKAGQFSRVTQERDLQEQRLEQVRLDQEQRQKEKEKAVREREAAEKRRVEQRAAPMPPEPTRTPPRVVAWKGPSSKPALPKPPSALEDIEHKPKDQEQAPAPQLRQEEPPKPQEAPPKKENSIAAMRERAAQLRQKEAPTLQQEPAKQPPIDKDQLRQRMQERAAQLKQQQQPAPQVQEKTRPKDKDRGPER